MSKSVGQAQAFSVTDSFMSDNQYITEIFSN